MKKATARRLALLLCALCLAQTMTACSDTPADTEQETETAADGDCRPEDERRKFPECRPAPDTVKLRLALVYLRDGLFVCFNINSGVVFQPFKGRFGYPRKLIFELFAVPCKRLVDVFDQKKTSRALALTSAEAVNGILVVYPAFAATIILVGQA